MKLELIASGTEKRKRVKPVDHFKKCPACGCKELIDVSPDVLCASCDWDSTLWDVCRGGMESPAAAAREFGFTTLRPVASSATPAPVPFNIRKVEGA
jgi:hypothetical protein